MRQSASLLASIAALTLCGAFGAHAADAPAIQMVGRGVQIYSCQPAGTSFAWKLKGPDAVLYASVGKPAGRHFAGPSWQAADGSTIVGQPLVSSPPPQPGSIAWLVLRVISSSGEGLFANVTYVTRTATEGGVAPASGCDPAHPGAETRSPYSATYTFFTGPTAPTH
jgi:hypothetical protein